MIVKRVLKCSRCGKEIPYPVRGKLQKGFVRMDDGLIAHRHGSVMWETDIVVSHIKEATDDR